MKQRNWKPPGSYHRTELNELVERVKMGHDDAIEEAVVFATKESFGLGHGRTRAKICRNLKNRCRSQGLQDLLVQAICSRLLMVNFSEQFKDQLAMAIRFRPYEMAVCAKQACESPKDYVRRYGQWVLDKLARTNRNL